MKPTRAVIDPVTLGVIALVAIGAFTWLAKPFGTKETRAAQRSAEVSAEVEKRVAASNAAEQAKAATISASVQEIGRANAAAPESPSKTFIGRETSWLTPLMPAPDPTAQLAAERRRIAVMEGRLEEANLLYATAEKSRADLLARATKAEAATAAAFAARRQADQDLAVMAEVNLALERRSNLQWAALACAGILAAFLWLNGVSPAKIGRAIADIRAGNAPGEAFGNVLPEWMHARVQAAARLAAPSKD